MEKKWQRILVGVFDIISGFLAFLVAAALSHLRASLLSLEVSLFVVLGFFAVLGILALAGGICALYRKIRGLALAGSLSASICLPPLGVPASIVVLSEKVPKAIRLLILILFGPLWLSYVGLVALIIMGYSL